MDRPRNGERVIWEIPGAASPLPEPKNKPMSLYPVVLGRLRRIALETARPIGQERRDAHQILKFN